MYELTYSDIEFLKKEVGKSGITFSHLQDDLIDHVCCDVEAEMTKGLPFGAAYELVKRKIGIGGLQRVQENTLYLTNKNYRTMKKMMKIFGIISPILIAFGTLFKIEHWPAAGILLVFGFFFLSFVFLPSAFYVSYKELSNKTRKGAYLIGLLGTFLLSIGFLFKVQHWPGTPILLTIGTTITCFAFLPSLLIHEIRKGSSETPKYIFILAYIGLILFLMGFLFKMQHWPGANILNLCGIVLLVFISFPIYTFKKYRDRTNVDASFIYIVFLIIWVILPISLISVNVSRNILATNLENERVYLTDIRLLKERNKALSERITGLHQAEQVKAEADSMVSYIQSIKADMVNMTSEGHSHVSFDKDIEAGLEQLTELGTTSFQVKVLKNGKGNELQKKYTNLRNHLLSAQKNEVLNGFIGKIIPAKLDDEVFNQQSTMVSSLNSLTFMQLNILRAENTCLSGIAEQATTEKLADHNDKK